MLRLSYTQMAEWPPLAWLAICRRKDMYVEVLHGRGVQTTDDWFGEVAWVGKHDSGDFDHTDLVAGSGARRRDDRIVFVSTGATVERLHSLTFGDATWVSNSLPCVLAGTGATLDPSYPHYYRDLSSVVRGLSKYVRTLPTSEGPVELTYFDNLSWDGATLVRQNKPGGPRDFSTFAHYRGFLESSLGLFAENLAARSRSWPFRMLGTLSSGYDSSTVATLARQAGCEEVLCFDRGPITIGSARCESDAV
jgi:hypothetical protein